MNRRARYALFSLGAAVGLLAAYYALPVALGIASLGEICAYSPLGTNLCGPSRDTGPSALDIRGLTDCKRDGIRYVGIYLKSTP